MVSSGDDASPRVFGVGNLGKVLAISIGAGISEISDASRRDFADWYAEFTGKVRELG